MPDGDLWFFERIARLYDLAMPTVDRGALSAALALAERDIERVVDVGGGTGRAIRAVDAPRRAVVDASPRMLGRVPAGIERVLASAPDLPVAGASVDAVLIVDALHHLPERDRVLAEAARALRPGGVLLVREFDRATLRGRGVELAERLLGMGSRFYAVGGLADAVEAAGLEAAVTERGFACTVAGRKPAGPG